MTTETSIRFNRLPPLVAVQEFMSQGGQTTSVRNPKQALMYIGLMCEELGEGLTVLAEAAVATSDKTTLERVAGELKRLSLSMRQGMHLGDMMRADQCELLDATLDTAWVAMGAALSMSTNAHGAWREVARANFDKYPGGQATRDAGGKIMKPADWRGPDLSPFVHDYSDHD